MFNTYLQYDDSPRDEDMQTPPCLQGFGEHELKPGKKEESVKKTIYMKTFCKRFYSIVFIDNESFVDLLVYY